MSRAVRAHPTAPVGGRSGIGESPTRKEDERLLRGLGRFVDDVELPDTLHMAVGRCPYPHARILSIDLQPALELPGVAAFLTGGEVARRTEPIVVLRPLPDVPHVPYYAMAREVALFEGQPVVSVVATDRYVAEDAIQAVDIDWEPLPHVSDVDAAMAPDAPLLHPDLGSNLLVTNPRGRGDVDSVFADAEVVIADRFVINRVTGLPMEGRGVVARYLPGVGSLDVWSSTQLPHLVRMQLARSLRIAETNIRVMAQDVGGGFGLKLGLYPEELLACLHTMDLGRPVKWIEDRMEHLRMTTHARQAVHDVEMAADAGGRILAMRDVYRVDAGAFNSPFGPPMLSSLMFTGPYRVNDAYVERQVIVTNKTPVGAYRGYGQPESNFVREVLVDRLARRVGLDPVEMRRKNLLRPEDLPHKTPGGAVYDSGDYASALDLALRRIGYEEIRRSQPGWRSEGRRIGVGVSCFVEMTGYPGSRFLGRHNAKYGAHESVTIRVNRSGGADLYTGVAPFGQGTETSFAQIAGHLLGIDLEDIVVRAGDTVGSPHNTGSFASRTTIAGAGAIAEAAEQIRSKAIRIASHLLGVPADRLELAAGEVRDPNDPMVRVPLATVATEAILGHRLPDGEAPGLEATAYFDPPANTFGYGTAAALVEVDERTGEFEVQRFVLAHDCGTRINPRLVDGQIHGGLAQGFGAALFEELLYDPETGQLVNGSMVEYLMPTAADLPTFELEHVEVPSPVTPFGVRGVGEAGTIPPAAAVANAICDALAPLPLHLDRLPITAERVWRAICEAQGGPNET
jgi:carbon-monoxide dehydrogenase large subunit